jgi:hypothetical protein
MADQLIAGAIDILCETCAGRGYRSWPADSTTCKACAGSGLAPDVRAGQAIRALIDAVECLRSVLTKTEVGQETARDRLAEARGFIAVHAIPALACDEAMAELVAEMRAWLEVNDG